MPRSILIFLKYVKWIKDKQGKSYFMILATHSWLISLIQQCLEQTEIEISLKASQRCHMSSRLTILIYQIALEGQLYL